jgi:hypothetical protein
VNNKKDTIFADIFCVFAAALAVGLGAVVTVEGCPVIRIPQAMKIK